MLEILLTWTSNYFTFYYCINNDMLARHYLHSRPKLYFLNNDVTQNLNRYGKLIQ